MASARVSGLRFMVWSFRLFVMKRGVAENKAGSEAEGLRTGADGVSAGDDVVDNEGAAAGIGLPSLRVMLCSATLTAGPLVRWRSQALGAGAVRVRMSWTSAPPLTWAAMALY